jgi:hypothetical protein
MVVWREKLIAFAIHFLVTLLLAGLAAALIFLVWYPDPFQEMLGGTRLFLLVVGCDLALGPLISLVIYNSRKSRRELITDYSIVGAVQLVAFATDRLEVIRANEIADADLEDASPRFRTRPLRAPELAATHVPADQQQEVLFSALEGRDAVVLPRYYVDYESERAAILSRAKPIDELERTRPEAKALVDAALAEVQRPRNDVRWLPVKHARGFWTAIIDATTTLPLAYIPLDPY